MDIAKPVTDLDLRRQNKYREVKIEPYTGFHPVIEFFQLYQVFCLAGG